MRVKTYRSVAEVEEAKWDAIVEKDRIFCAYKYVEALEKSGLNEGRCYYPVVYGEGDEIVAHAAVYFITTEMDIFARGILKKIIHGVRRKWKNFFILRSIECGPPIALGSSLSFKAGADRKGALELLSQEIERLAKELRINLILLRDFYDKETGFYDTLKERRYMKIHNLPKAQLKVSWKTFDEYLNSMRSNYRCKIIKSMDKGTKANVTLSVLKNFSENAGEMKRLYDNVYDQAKEVKRDRLGESFFKNFDKYLGDKAIVLSAAQGDRLIGYMLLVFGGKTMISMFPGLDYDYSKEYCTYFNLFYKTIELAIEMGMDEIDMGITTLDPKKDMGSHILNLNMYMKHSNPLLNKILPVLFDMITPPDTTGPRNVFKAQDKQI